MKLFLDDVRQPQECAMYMHSRIGKLNPIYMEDWIIVRNYKEFCKILAENIDSITHISFDHDLADEHYTLEYSNIDEMYANCKEKTGLECAKFTKELYKEKGLPLPTMFVHSMNPMGTENIVNVFKAEATHNWNE